MGKRGPPLVNAIFVKFSHNLKILKRELQAILAFDVTFQLNVHAKMIRVKLGKMV